MSHCSECHTYNGRLGALGLKYKMPSQLQPGQRLCNTCHNTYYVNTPSNVSSVNTRTVSSTNCTRNEVMCVMCKRYPSTSIIYHRDGTSHLICCSICVLALNNNCPSCNKPIVFIQRI